MNITTKLSHWAGATPDAPAVVTSAVTVTYAQVDRMVSRAAADFATAGLAPGDVVVTQASDQLSQLLASFGLARLGVTQIGFAAADPLERQLELTAKVKPAAVIAERSLEIAIDVPRIDPPSADAEALARVDEANFVPSDDPALAFLLLATSGTTRGRPKIGFLSQRRAAARFENFILTGADCRFFSPIAMSYSGAVQNAYRCLLSGGSLFLWEELDDLNFIEFLGQNDISYIYAIPNQASYLVQMFGREKPVFPTLRALQLGTAFTPGPLREAIRARLTPNLYIHYGTTEVGIIAIATPDQIAAIPGAVGTPIPGVEIKITDEDGQVLPTGEIGEIRVRAAAAIDGYLDDEEENARAFEDGWFRPRDMAAVRDDGVLVHHGRADDVMIFDGINIYPFEIEDALLNHEAVAEAAAFSIKSVAHGDIPLAAVVLKKPVEMGELAAHCAAMLGTHKPQDVIELASLPRNAVGKVLKIELPDFFRREMERRKSSEDQGA